MTIDQQAHQVAQFLGYHKRSGLEWDLAFVSWSRSKHLSPDDYYAIRQVVHAELVALGVLALTDLPSLPDEDYPDDDDTPLIRAA